MAYPVCISVPENTAPSTDGGIYIKHVEFNGRDESKYHSEYRKLEKTLLFEYLKDNDSSFPENLMSVSFNTTMMQNKNNKVTSCENVLKRSIYCKGNTSMLYRFLGHSDSQLRERKCYLMRASQDEIHDLLARFGDFVKIRDVGKRASRIGLLFDPFNHFLKLGEEDYVVEPDAKSRFFETAPRAFTNGCGFMSFVFATKVRQQLGVDFPEPSVLQVNYQGFQGVLVLKEVPTRVPLVQFRESMQRFSTPKKMREATPIGIVDHSTPYINGYLDSRLIMFLAIRGVSTGHLKSLQKDYLNLLKNMRNDSASGEYFCHLTGRSAPTELEELEVLANLQQGEVEKMIDYVYDPNANNDESQRCRVIRTRILVPKSRVVFGVCDPYNKLKNGECYFKPTHQHDIEFEEVVVAPYPCYHPGDIQVLKLTQEKLEYENLKDCLVLPVNQRLPHAFEVSGASKFFVSWDQNLVPEKKKGKRCRYSPTRLEMQIDKLLYNANVNCRIRFHRNRREDPDEMIHYFADFKDDLPHRIGDVYTKFAQKHGPFSKECKKLSKMHYQAANLMANRDNLLKMLAKLETSPPTQPTRPTTPVNSPSAEQSPLLEREGENDDVVHRKPDGISTRILRFFRRKRVPPLLPVWKKFDGRTETFVKDILPD